MSRIQLRRGDASEWTDANTVLAAGEVGIELDTGKFKWGDGTTAWADLPYIGGGVQEVTEFDRDPISDDTGFALGTLWLNNDSGTLWVNKGDAETPNWVQIGVIPSDIQVTGSVSVQNDFGTAGLTANGEGVGGQVAANVAIIEGVTDGATSYLISVRRGAVTDGDGGGDSWGVKLHGQEYLMALDAPDDSEIATSERVQWFDDTEDAPTARFKERDSAGNLHSGRAASLTDDGSAFQGVDKVSLTVGDAAEIMAALVTLGLATDDT